jgi:hypothetical protein
MVRRDEEEACHPSDQHDHHVGDVSRVGDSPGCGAVEVDSKGDEAADGAAEVEDDPEESDA